MISRRRFLGVFAAILLPVGVVAGCLHVEDGQSTGTQLPSVEARDGGGGMRSGGGMSGM